VKTSPTFVSLGKLSDTANQLVSTMRGWKRIAQNLATYVQQLLLPQVKMFHIP